MNQIQELSKDKVVIQKQAEQKKEVKLVGRIKAIKGHTIWEVNMITGVISEAQFEKTARNYPVQIKGKSIKAHFDRFNAIIENPIRRKVKAQKGCIYISALNKKNLFRKMLNAGLIKIGEA